MLDKAGELVSSAGKAPRHALVTDPTVNRLYGGKVSGSLATAGLEHDIIEVPESEAAKSLAGAEALYGELARLGLGRDSRIIALGGGSVGDLAGFAAATYMRGIGIIQAPTTLLAQADSAIGGKTALNLPAGKNLVGTFHQPVMVISDTEALASLPAAELRSGMGEVVKCALACDAEFFGWLEAGTGPLAEGEPEALREVVVRCSAIKAGIVARDPEDLGERAVLNLGHTLGHALETDAGYGRLRHGEAVAAGTVYAARVSSAMGLLPEADLGRIESLLGALGLRASIGSAEPRRLLELMAGDKKARQGRLRMVLPTAIGRAESRGPLDEALLQNVLEGMA